MFHGGQLNLYWFVPQLAAIMSSNDRSSERLHLGYGPYLVLESTILDSFSPLGAIEALLKCSLNTCESASITRHGATSLDAPGYL